LSEEKKRKKKNEDILDMGRTMGSLAKTDEEIWAAIEKEAMLTGRKKHDIIAEKLAKAMIIEEVVQRGLTMEQLLAAWELKDRIESLLFKKVMTLGTVFFGTLLQQVGELVAGISQYQQEQISKIVEEEKKRDIDFQIKKTRATMASTLLQAMMPMITNLMSGVMKGLSATQLLPQAQQTQPLPQPQEQQQRKPKLIIIGEEDENE
jgi:hypothetical protein